LPVLALYFFWHRSLLAGLLVAIVPPLVVSGIILRFANLEKYAETKSGRLVQRHMTRAREFARLFGYAVMAVAAWSHQPWLILAGLLVILLAWFAATGPTAPEQS
jgi:hypothetical protein